MAKITILAFNDFMKANEDDLFQNLTLPEGIEKDTLIDNILLECAEFEVTYSNPSFMKKAIGIWSRKHYRTFEKWINALSIDYNPLENYDKQESWNDNSTENNTTNGSITGTNVNNVSGSNNNTSEIKKSAFDDNSYTPYENTTDAGSNTLNSNETNTSTSSGTNDTTKNDSHTGRIHGNIGVTTSQQMLESELDIARWNIIQNITDLFIQEFCVAIYV